MPKRCSTRLIIVLVDSTSCVRCAGVASTSTMIPAPSRSGSWSSRRRTLALLVRRSNAPPDRSVRRSCRAQGLGGSASSSPVGLNSSSASRYSRTARLVPAPLRHSGGLGARNTTCATGVCLDDAGVDREAFASDQALAHASTQHALEHMAEGIALAEPAMPVLGEGRMIGHGVFEIESAEPPIGQVQLDLFAKPRSERMPKQ